MEGKGVACNNLVNTMGHFTFWLRPWLSLLAQTKH